MPLDSKSGDPLGALIRDIQELDLHDIDQVPLRAAEFAQAQRILDDLPGKTIAKAEMQQTRIVIETDDGNCYFFFGFMGAHRK